MKFDCMQCKFRRFITTYQGTARRLISELVYLRATNWNRQGKLLYGRDANPSLRKSPHLHSTWCSSAHKFRPFTNIQVEDSGDEFDHEKVQLKLIGS